MSYEFYKVLHVIFILLFVASTAITLYDPNPKKLYKIFNGVATLLIFVAGMGLMARIGVSHGQGWPIWIKAKIALWLLAAIIAPVGAKRFKEKKELVMWVYLSLIFGAVILAVLQPGA